MFKVAEIAASSVPSWCAPSARAGPRAPALGGWKPKPGESVSRRSGDRDGLLLALLAEAEAEFREVHTSGPPPLGPGVPATERLMALGRALIERTASDADVEATPGRQVMYERRHASDTGQDPARLHEPRSDGLPVRRKVTWKLPQKCSLFTAVTHVSAGGNRRR